MMAAAVLAAASCTDFDDYNDVPGTDSANLNVGQTLWQNISQRGELSDFVALVQKTGYQETLEQLNAYTVWAPVNGQFDAAKYSAMSDSLLLERFVKNHIAKYNHSAMGEVKERVRMLNGKFYQFAGNGEYVYADVPLAQSNVVCSNGTLHLLNGAVEFYPNLYEYLSEVEGADSLVNYFKKYETTELNLKESEKGPMVNGMQTYVDSVMETSNSLLTRNRLNAALANEDSSYTFLIPTNEAYTKMYNRVKDCYKYLPTMTMQDVEKQEKVNPNTKDGDAIRNAIKKTSKEIDHIYLADSIARLNLVSHLIYNNRDTSNLHIESTEWTDNDTIRSTRNGRFSNPKEIFEDYLADEPVRMSNGWARKVDSLAFKTWELYNPELEYPVRHYVGKSFLSKVTSVPVPDSTAQKLLGPDAIGFTYNLYAPADEFSVPNLFIKLPNVRAAKYNFYCVVLPASLGAELTTKPTPMNFNLSYCGAGGLTNYHFSSNGTDNPNILNESTAFISSDITKVDTIYLGQFTFPYCYDGVRDVNPDGTYEEYYPSINISCPLLYSDSLYEPLYDQYSTEMRILSIILRPAEQDEYEENNK